MKYKWTERTSQIVCLFIYWIERGRGQGKAGNVTRVGQMRNARTNLVGQLERERQLVGHRCTWEDTVEMELIK
jgi:hypothetical protein